MSSKVSRREKLTIENISRLVCQYYDLSKESIKVKNKSKVLVSARRIIYALSYNSIPESTYKSISAYYNRHHSTIIHHCQRHEELMQVDPKYAARVRSIEQQMERVHYKYKPYMIARCQNCKKVYLAVEFNNEMTDNSLASFVIAARNGDEVIVCDITDFDLGMCMC